MNGVRGIQPAPRALVNTMRASWTTSRKTPSMIGVGPSGPLMIRADRPPGRRSCSTMRVVQGFGAHHSSRRSVQTR